MIRYHRARQSHCLVTDRWHLYFFPHSVTLGKLGRYVHSGVTLKHRRKDRTWRVTTLKAEKRVTFGRSGGTAKIELDSYLASDFKSGRKRHTKKFIRFKVGW